MDVTSWQTMTLFFPPIYDLEVDEIYLYVDIFIMGLYRRHPRPHRNNLQFDRRLCRVLDTTTLYNLPDDDDDDDDCDSMRHKCSPQLIMPKYVSLSLAFVSSH